MQRFDVLYEQRNIRCFIQNFRKIFVIVYSSVNDGRMILGISGESAWRSLHANITIFAYFCFVNYWPDFRHI